MRVIFLVAICLVVSLGGATRQSSAQDKRYAAVDANNEAKLTVVWANDKDVASRRAVAACKRVSKTCSGKASYTNELDDLFAYVCCETPRFGCSIGVGAEKADALAMVRKTFDDAGFSRCRTPRYWSAETGKPL